jgi:aminopeptidase-like protein
MDLISGKALEDSLKVFLKIVEHIEADRFYVNLFPKGEPQLGKRGLYDAVGGSNESKNLQLAFLWILNYSDGIHSLTEISMLSGIEVDTITKAAGMLLEKGLLREKTSIQDFDN